MDVQSLERISRRLEGGDRLDLEDGRSLLREIPLAELGTLAHRERCRRNPPSEVTYVLDSNPNYTNVCVTDCAF